MNNRPIGIFDSGVGGTSVWKEINQLLPSESTIYLADSKNAPYGEKPKAAILQLSIKNTELLLKRGSKLIVVACNTATTNTIAYLRKHYKIPFIGIEPAIKPAALKSSSRTIGILATKGTLGSHLFHKTSQNHGGNIRIIEQEGAGLVTLIEAGKVRSNETRKLLQEFLKPMLKENIDHLVLGCTHYPYLLPVLKELLPKNVKIIDCGGAVARQTSNILEKNNLLNITDGEGSHAFYTNSDPEILKNFLIDIRAAREIKYLDF